MTLPAPSERQIQRAVVEYARLTGWVVWEMLLGSAGNGRVYTTPGIPDLYLFRPGAALWIELKRPRTGRLSVHQKARHAELRRCGRAAHVIRSFDEARALLDDQRRSE